MEQENKNIITIESFDSLIQEDKKSRKESGFMSDPEEVSKFKLDSYIDALTAIKNQILANITECGERIKAELKKGGLGGQNASKKYEKIFDGLLTRVASMLAEAEKQREKGRKLKDAKLIEAFREDYKTLSEDTQKAVDGYTSEKNEEIAGMAKNLRDKELISPMGAALKAFQEADELAKDLIPVNSMLTGKNGKSGKDKINTSDIKIETPIKQWNGGEGSETVKKVQQLIYDKFKDFKGVGDHQLFKLFTAAKGFPDGKNGKNTSNLIMGLKKGFGLKDTSSDITQDFVDQLYSMKESLSIDESKLLSFDQFISKESLKEGFNLDAFNSASKSFSSGDKKDSKKGDSTGFTNEEEGNAFRKWVNEKHPDWAKENKLDPKGSFDNSYIRKALEKFKDEYKKGKTEEKKRVFDLKKYYEAIKKYVEEYSVFAKSKVELDTKGGELTIIITNSNDKNQYMVIYNNKRIKYSISENKSYMGKILDTSLSLEKWKVKFDSKNIKNDFSFLELCVVRAKKQLIGELGDSEDQGKKVYPSGDYVNVRSGPYADTKGANQNLIYKHDNKKKSIGIYLMKQLTKGKGDIKDWNWYKIQFPEKIKGWETGWVREDTVELK